MAFSFLPKEDEYFVLFSKLSVKIQEASGLLVEMLNGPRDNFEPLSRKIKSVEHECDELNHTVITRLNRSFITPFDREDIYTLSGALDDVCDYIDAAARVVVMYDVQEVDTYSKQLGTIIQKLADEISAAVALLQKAKGLEKHLVEIQRLENDADEVYFNAIAALFKNTQDPIQLIKMKELYEILENATDLCEYVGNIMESIVLKHS